MMSSAHRPGKRNRFFSWLGPLLDPLAHTVGVSVLTYTPLESTWAWLIQLPVMPWTRFDNSIVMGSLVIGLLAAYPLYRISRYLFEVYGKAIYESWRKTGLARPMHSGPGGCQSSNHS